MGIETYLNKRILIADDLPNMRQDLVKILIGLGFSNFKEVPDGKAALEELRFEASNGKPYDIIFTDINMPLMNGIMLLKSLRQLEVYKKSPIFVVSTVNEKDVIVKAILEGATDYIIKPYNPTTVKEKLFLKLK